MPKMKTHRGTAKRIRVKASSFKRKRAYRSHNFSNKSTKQKRHLRGVAHVHVSDEVHMKRLLPYYNK